MKKCFAALMLAAVVLGAVPAQGAPADDEFFRLAARRNWLSYADARPVSPYFGIPGELRPGAPFARSYIDASPGRSECFASLYYPDEVLEEGLDGEPVISYAMTIAGLENSGQPVVGVGAKGIILAGQQVAGRDFIDQFNTEVAKAGATFKDKAWSDSIQLVAPSVEKDGD